jgi:3D (Asp-Asp-Asp) domain-containing protein
MRKIALIFILILASFTLINPTDSLSAQSEVNKSKGGNATSAVGESDLKSVQELYSKLADVEKSINTLNTKSNQLEKDISIKYQNYLDKKRALEEQAKKKQALRESKESSPSGSVARSLYVTASAYTASCAGCSGRTATGLNLRANPSLKVIAVDPRVIPLGSRVWVEGYGYAIAGDTGGAIKGNKIDIFISSYQSAVKWGRRQVLVKILE